MSEERNLDPAEMYERYFVPGNFGRWAPLLLERAAPAPGERVLDVGCGTGIVARQVAPRVGPDGEVVALDPNPQMLAVARAAAQSEGARITWLQSDAETLPEGPFDLVTCQQSLQFVPERAAATRAMRRVLAPGGRAAVSVWRELERQPLYAALIQAEARHLGIAVEEVAGPPFTMGDPAVLHDLLADAGFIHVDLEAVTHEVRFPEPDRFVELTTLAAASVLPAFQEMHEDGRQALLDAVHDEVAPVLRDYVRGDAVVFPMEAHLAVAYA